MNGARIGVRRDDQHCWYYSGRCMYCGNFYCTKKPDGGEEVHIDERDYQDAVNNIPRITGGCERIH